MERNIKYQDALAKIYFVSTFILNTLAYFKICTVLDLTILIIIITAYSTVSFLLLKDTSKINDVEFKKTAIFNFALGIFALIVEILKFICLCT